MLDWDPGEREKVQAAIDAAMVELKKNKVGDSTVGDVMNLMMGN